MARHSHSAALALLLGGACAEQQEALIVERAISWPDDGACVADASINESLAMGRLDVEIGTPYIVALAVQNRLQSQDPNASGTGTDNAEMQLVDADVRIEVPQSPELIAGADEGLLDFTWPLATISLPPETTQGVFVEVIPQGLAVHMRDRLPSLPLESRPIVIVKITINARRTGNSKGGIGDVAAREFAFPIQICSGCLFTCVGCEEGQCPQDITGIVGGVCGNTQDLFHGPDTCENPIDARG